MDSGELSGLSFLISSNSRAMRSAASTASNVKRDAIGGRRRRGDRWGMGVAVFTGVLAVLAGAAGWRQWRHGRRTVRYLGLVGAGASLLFVLGILVGTGLIQGLFAGPIGAFVSELFPPKVRYTGASMSYQLASTIGAGFTPMIAAALMLAGGFNAVALFWIAVLATALICIRLVPEGAEALKDTQSARSEYKTAKRIATRPRRDLTSTSSSASEE